MNFFKNTTKKNRNNFFNIQKYSLYHLINFYMLLENLIKYIFSSFMWLKIKIRKKNFF